LTEGFDCAGTHTAAHRASTAEQGQCC